MPHAAPPPEIPNLTLRDLFETAADITRKSVPLYAEAISAALSEAVKQGRVDPNASCIVCAQEDRARACKVVEDMANEVLRFWSSTKVYTGIDYRNQVIQAVIRQIYEDFLQGKIAIGGVTLASPEQQT